MQRRDANFLDGLIETHELEVKNNDQATRLLSERHSIIDLTLATPGAAPFCQEWRILDDSEAETATGPDHVVIEWKWTKPAPAVAKGWKMRGWALKSQLENEKRRNGHRTGPSWTFCGNRR